MPDIFYLRNNRGARIPAGRRRVDLSLPAFAGDPVHRDSLPFFCSFCSISQVERTAGQSIGNGRQRAARLSRILSLSLEPSLPPRLQSLSYVQRRFSAVTTKIPSKLDARVVATLRSRRISLVSTIYKPRRERSAPAPFLSTYLQPSPKLWVLKHSQILGLKALHIQ